MKIRGRGALYSEALFRKEARKQRKKNDEDAERRKKKLGFQIACLP